ncbi:MAG: hypothetical protein N3E45_12545 [Oscillatoriaceae bacterium SKW80]|nr:hypothetical protein [Oscillatoriaceae bacterium SKYG93]MCX8121631.1 hypothetical protein [Oscillatoriaceae bacterium SKW80]MDW8453939.1 hypothetical protein [Oscillatoriaceae cyanobacterium SKYGB_i_bin93]HIK28816.1 hypothetical protein [Oscillatoriaceae cyanobacterium M7585_C2015_266]
MPSALLHKFLTTPASKTPKSIKIFWFSLSMTFAALYSLLALRQALSSEYVVQDDARQHVFWMQRFLEPDLFPNDLIADYFESVAPAGYVAVYALMATVGITPLLLSKLLPLVLDLVATVYCFGVSMQLFPVPFAGFLATLLLNQSLWMQDGLISATPKAFVYPLFMAFLYYFLKRALLAVGICILLLGLFYPQCVLIAAALTILQLVEWKKWHFRLSQNRHDYLLCAASLCVTFFILLPYALSTSEFEPTITVAEAKTMPEFLPGGRSSFFVKDPWQFWLHGRSGIGLSSSLTPAFMAAGFLLPVLLRYPSRFPLSNVISERIAILPQLLIASLAMFFAAHALLFKLHLPSRYTQHSFRIVIALSAALALTLILEALLSLFSGKEKTWFGLFLLFPCSFILITYPNFTMKKFPWTYYVSGEEPALYKFFKAQPKDIIIASLTEEANNLPTFAHRSILVGREYAVPYHMGYYKKFRERVFELLLAQYSTNISDVQKFAQKYGVDFWLLEKGAFTPDYIAKNRWLSQYQPAAASAIANLYRGILPALADVSQKCSVFETGNFFVLTTDCILKNNR